MPDAPALQPLGFSPRWEALFAEFEGADLYPARVVRADRGSVRIAALQQLGQEQNGGHQCDRQQHRHQAATAIGLVEREGQDQTEAQLERDRADASAQLDLSGQADVVVKHGTDRYGVNRGLRGNTPFAPVRVRLLASRWFNERIGFFGELLFDTETAVTAYAGSF